MSTEIPRVPGNTKGRAIHFARQHEKILRDAFRVALIASQGTTPRGVTSRARVSNYFRNLIDRLRRLTGRRIG